MTKLWLVRRTDRIGYDEYDSMVVVADTELEARTYHPNGDLKARFEDGFWWYYYDLIPKTAPYYGKKYTPSYNSWGSIKDLAVEYLGTTDRDIKGVVLASFNAG